MNTEAVLVDMYKYSHWSSNNRLYKHKQNSILSIVEQANEEVTIQKSS